MRDEKIEVREEEVPSTPIVTIEKKAGAAGDDYGKNYLQ